MRAKRPSYKSAGAEAPEGGVPVLDRKLIKRLLPFIHPYRWQLLLAMLLVILVTFLELALPYITKTAIDRHIVPVRQDAQATQRYLEVDPQQPHVTSLIEQYPHLFLWDAATVQIAYADLTHLTPAQRLHLRQPDMDGLTRLAGLFLVLILMGFGANLMQQRLMEAAGQRGMHRLRQEVFAHLLKLPVTFFNHNPVGRLVTRVTNDVQNLHELFTSIIVFIFKDILMLVGISVVLLSLNLRLALLTFLVIPVVVLASSYFARRSRHIFSTLRRKISEINTRFSETISGMRVLQLFGQESANYSHFKVLNHEHYQAGMRQVHIFALFMPIIEILGSVAVAIIIYQGGAGVMAGELSLGEMVIFLAYMKMFFRPVRDITEKHNILQNALASSERIFNLLDTPPAPESAAPSATVPGRSAKAALAEGPTGAAQPPVRQICFDNVTFGYNPSEPVLHNISFTLPAGRTLALVGATGSGKTTLIQLLLRFYAPDQGRIRINDVDLQDIARAHLHQTMALVSQDPVLFSESIAANILGGNPSLSESRLQEILELSQCHHFLARLPEGLETRLGEGGTLISSGERQLIAIARAFARNSQVIILDEATSYIDSHSEQLIGQALANLMQGRTTIIVAHRLATIRHAQSILVFRQGRIVESGSHSHLMAQQGYYFHLNQLDG